MSPENNNSAPKEITPEQKVQLEQNLSNSELTQDKVDSILGQYALAEKVAINPHVSEEGNRLLAEHVHDPTEGDGTSDKVAIEAAQRQLDFNQAKHDLGEVAAHNDWSQDQYDEALKQLQ